MPTRGNHGLRRRRPPRPGALTDLSPLRILTQIAILQLAYYMTGIVLIVFAALSGGKHMQLDLVLDWHTLRGDNTEGWTYGLCWVLDSGVMVILLLLLIARSKLIPDFALTIHGINLVITSFYTRSIPTYLFWWLVQITSSCTMVFVGMWACRWRELKPISFGGSWVSGASEENGTTVRNAIPPSSEADEGVGYIYGQRKTSRRGDGAVAYEMVNVKEPA